MSDELKSIISVNIKTSSLSKIIALEKVRKAEAKPRALTQEETSEQLRIAKKKGTSFANHWAYKKRREDIKPYSRSAIVDELVELGLKVLAGTTAANK